jgi:hypothetical protein
MGVFMRFYIYPPFPPLQIEYERPRLFHFLVSSPAILAATLFGPITSLAFVFF